MDFHQTLWWKNFQFNFLIIEARLILKFIEFLLCKNVVLFHIDEIIVLEVLYKHLKFIHFVYIYFHRILKIPMNGKFNTQISNSTCHVYSEGSDITNYNL